MAKRTQAMNRANDKYLSDKVNKANHDYTTQRGYAFRFAKREPGKKLDNVLNIMDQAHDTRQDYIEDLKTLAELVREAIAREEKKSD